MIKMKLVRSALLSSVEAGRQEINWDEKNTMQSRQFKLRCMVQYLFFAALISAFYV
jgi:hypothetical protein